MRWVSDWKRSIALVILFAYAYQLVMWPMLWWLVAILNSRGVAMPFPPIIPWEQLFAGTTTLASIGGIQALRERGQAPDGAAA